jgi:hypothetical protein
LGATGFNGFDAALRDTFVVALGGAFPSCFLAVLAGSLTAPLRVLLAAVLADAAGLTRAAFPEGVFAFPEGIFPTEVLETVLGDVLGDFLRVFLDIRLPFVAFGGSIIRVLRVVSGHARIKPAAGHI